ncbi:MAG TPA: PAS domain S-box protein [Vicinamibacterales bacterium]|nr:PAS domain S-box protein [Vicinamibacterales bacterium]
MRNRPVPTTSQPPASRRADELFRNHPVPLCVHERVTLRFLAVNDAALAQYGYSRDEFLSMTLLDLLVEPTEHQVAALTCDMGRRRQWRQFGVCRQRRRDGRVIHAELTSHDLDFDGTPAIVVTAYEVTVRIAAEAAALEAEQQLRSANDRLRDSESRYRELVESLDDVVFSIDPDGAIAYVSQAVEQFGYSPADLLGTPFQTVVHPDDLPSVMASFGEALAGNTRKREFRVFDKSGETRFVRAASRVQLRDGHPPSVAGVLIDLTDQHRAQEQLKVAGRLEAMGRLAGGVAHDFNNLLVAINGFAELALSDAADGSSLQSDLSEIIKAGNRAASLTAQLLAFSRRQVLRPDSVCLTDVVLSMEPMLRRLIGEDVELIIETTPDLPPVRIDTGHLEQVVMNLVVNARDAMPGGGTLRIGTSSGDFPGDDLPGAVTAGDVSVLTVSDTGHGMDEATQAQIFEPFFTTKPLGEGTGLGLAMVYGFVKQSGGAINVRSAPGEGTTFSIALPRTHEDVLNLCPLPAAVEHGTGTLLVTEDEDTVRTLVRRVLERAGYLVLTADTPDEALRLCRSHEGPIDLLLTDVVMPQMSGTRLAEQARALRPAMRVLFMSGYSGQDISTRGLQDGAERFLQKPFSAGALSEAVRSALAQSAVPAIQETVRRAASTPITTI